jgi:hypothetical protein
MASTFKSYPNYPLLSDAGFNFPQANLTNKQIESMEGRLNNVQIMAHAMDIFDKGKSNIVENKLGSKTFFSLMSCGETAMLGCVYVAMRRFQRENKLAELRATLTLLIMAENGVLAFADILQTVSPEVLELYNVPI